MSTTRSLVAASIAVVLAACNPKPNADAPAAGSPPATEPAAAPSPPPAQPEAEPSGATPARPACEQNFEAFDGSGDERVSLQEFLDRPHAVGDPEGIFKARDADADGSLTRDEFCSGWGTGGPRMGMGQGSGMGPGSGVGPGSGMGPGAARTPTMGMGPGSGMGPGMGPGHGMGMGRGSGMGPGGGRRCEEHFARFDANADGKVSEQEFTALPHPHADPHAVFVARDQNKDGVLTVAEFCAAWNPPSSPAP